MLIATSVSLIFSLAHFANPSWLFFLERSVPSKAKNVSVYMQLLCYSGRGLFITTMFKAFVVFFPVGYNRLRGICSKRPC